MEVLSLRGRLVWISSVLSIAPKHKSSENSPIFRPPGPELYITYLVKLFVLISAINFEYFAVPKPKDF